MGFVSKIVIAANGFLLANGPGASSSSSKSTDSSFFTDIIAAVLKFFSGIFSFLWELIVGFVFTIVKYCLNIVDFLQFFVQKLVGIDIWMPSGKGISSIKDVAEMDVILNFIFKEEVQRVFWAIIGLGIVLVIIFTIIAIIKSNYASVTDQADKADNKPSKIIYKALRSIFLFFMVPVLVVFGIIGSNAVLASILNTIQGDNKLTIGGTIFIASSYEANKYREYASNGTRVPMIVNEPTAVVKPSTYSSINDMMDLFYKLVKRDAIIPYVSDSSEFAERSWGVWHTDNSISPIEIKQWGETPSDKDGFDKDFLWFYNKYCDSTVLDDMKKNNPLIASIYDYNITYNKKFYERVYNFSETYTVSDTVRFRGAKANTRIYSNSILYSEYESFATIPYEYYVMADVMEYSIKQYEKLFFVNANNKAIDWSNVEGYDDDYVVGFDSKTQKYYYGMGKYMPSDYEKIADGMFYVNYYNNTSRAYWSNNNTSSEQDGSTYIICFKNENGEFVPLTQENSKFKSSFLASEYKGAIVARGLFAETTLPLSYNLPTMIIEQEVDNAGNEITISDREGPSSVTIRESDLSTQRINDVSRKVLSTDKVKYYKYSSNTLELFDKYNRIIKTYKTSDDNAKLEVLIDENVNLHIYNFSESGVSLKQGDDYKEISSENPLKTQVYAQAKFKVFKITDSSVSGSEFYIYLNPEITGISDKEVKSDSEIKYKTNLKINDYFYLGMHLGKKAYQEKISTLQVRNGKVYETGSGSVFFEMNNLNNSEIVSNGSNIESYLKKTNLNVYRDNAINELPGAVFYDVIETDLILYNNLRTKLEKIELSGQENNNVVRKYKAKISASDSINFVYIHLIKTVNKNKVVDAIWSNEKSPEINTHSINYSNDPNYKIYTFKLNADVTFDYINNTVYGAQLSSVYLTAFGNDSSTLLEPDDYFQITNNNIYCIELNRNIINSSDIKQEIINIGEITSDGAGIVVDFNAMSWNTSQITNYENYYIYFVNGKVKSTIYIDFTIGFKDFSFAPLNIDFITRLKVGTSYQYIEKVEYRLNAGGFILDYNFREGTGIAVKNLYSLGKINPLILVFSTLIVLSIFIKIVWGLVARIYEIVILYILMPAYASTFPLDDGERFKRWKDELISKVLMAYGTLISFNIYFVLLPIVESVTTDFISWGDLPQTVTGFVSSFTGSANNIQGSNIINSIIAAVGQLTESQMVISSFINKLIYILFFLVLTTMLSTMPGMINKILGSGEDLRSKSDDTLKNVNADTKKVASYTTGKALASSAKTVAKTASSFVPGAGLIGKGASALGKAVGNKVEKSWNKHKEKKSEKKAERKELKNEVKELKSQRRSARREERDNRYEEETQRMIDDINGVPHNNQVVESNNEQSLENSKKRRFRRSLKPEKDDSTKEPSVFSTTYNEARDMNVGRFRSFLSAAAISSKHKVEKTKQGIKDMPKNFVKKSKEMKENISSGIHQSVENMKTNREQKRAVRALNKAQRMEARNNKTSYIASVVNNSKYTKRGKERGKIRKFVKVSRRVSIDAAKSVFNKLIPIGRKRRKAKSINKKLKKSIRFEKALNRNKSVLTKKIYKKLKRNPEKLSGRVKKLMIRKANIEKAKDINAGRITDLSKRSKKATSKSLGVKYKKPASSKIKLSNTNKNEKTKFAKLSNEEFNAMYTKQSEVQNRFEDAMVKLNNKIANNINVEKNKKDLVEIRKKHKLIKLGMEQLEKENKRRNSNKSN